MARTILGLVNWTDGKVYFGDPPCDTRIECIAEDVEGCVEWTGEHAGQVKVTITQADLAACNDTYYGCVNWTTGKFQITIPSGCCSAEIFCDDCNAPETITAVVSGVTFCSPCADDYSDCAINGTFTLTFVEGGGCPYTKHASCSQGAILIGANLVQARYVDCPTPPYAATTAGIAIGNKTAFDGITCGHCQTVMSNIYDEDCSCLGAQVAYGGTITLSW